MRGSLIVWCSLGWLLVVSGPGLKFSGLLAWRHLLGVGFLAVLARSGAEDGRLWGVLGAGCFTDVARWSVVVARCSHCADVPRLRSPAARDRSGLWGWVPCLFWGPGVPFDACRGPLPSPAKPDPGLTRLSVATRHKSGYRRAVCRTPNAISPAPWLVPGWLPLGHGQVLVAGVGPRDLGPLMPALQVATRTLLRPDVVFVPFGGGVVCEYVPDPHRVVVIVQRADDG